MSAVTPLSKARLALRAIHRFQAGARRAAEQRALEGIDEEAGAPSSSAAQPDLERAESGGMHDIMLPLLPKRNALRSTSHVSNSDVDSPRTTAAAARRVLNNELPHLTQTGSGTVRQETDGTVAASELDRLASGSELRKLPKDESTADEEPAPGVISVTGDLTAIWGLLTSSWLNILLASVPLGYLAHYLKWPALMVFLFNFLSLVPLALLLGEVTEDLAIRFGDTIGGLLNATFGNVVELILSVAALQKGLYDVVATSLVGSVLSNLLLVLGCCFLVGGTQYHNQNFNAQTNKAMCSLLMLASIALAMPTAAHRLYGAEAMPPASLLKVSHGTSILLVATYCFYLFFQLKTHAELEPSATDGGGEGDGEEEGKEAETPALSLLGALSVLTVITVLVAAASEFLTGSIEEVSEGTGINRAFLGLIVLPIAGNACEHITAVFVAAKNKMDLAIGVALGSSIQIAIFVVPVVCLAGWAMGRDFTLDFDPLSVIILTLSTIHAYFVSNDGTSNWLMGVQLITTYLLIAVVYFFRGTVS